MNLPTSFSELPVNIFVAGLCVGYLIGIIFCRKKSENTNSEDTKQSELQNEIPTHTVALIVNSSLKMGKGKIAAQCGHAIISLCKKANKNSKKLLKEWIEEGQDITLFTVNSSENFDDLMQMAEMESLNQCVIADAGRTQIKSGSLTVMGLGPADIETINRVVGQLPLYL
ncbi:peptidyl-tRNA hydrolase 2, mitochondrial-like [Lycorma delicatula]|uniref:peptidyl-tRNA hydrolase 2, mitochondrial-like n=1 Tax=Lycorma delicatula TaxID=130591 RepID=UPI003F513570